MKLAILWTFGILLLTLAHLGFQPPDAPKGMVTLQLEAMLAQCLEAPEAYKEAYLVECSQVESVLNQERN